MGSNIESPAQKPSIELESAPAPDTPAAQASAPTDEAQEPKIDSTPKTNEVSTGSETPQTQDNGLNAGLEATPAGLGEEAIR